MKLINAGIKSKKEAAQRLIDGEIFYSSDGSKIFFDKATDRSPFRFDVIGMSSFWDHFKQWQIEDPYAELEEAMAAGKIIQTQNDDGDWNNIYAPLWSLPPERYRVKPEPKTVKKYIVTVVDGFVDKAEWVEVNEDEC